MGVLPFYRKAVCVFYSPSRLGNGLVVFIIYLKSYQDSCCSVILSFCSGAIVVFYHSNQQGWTTVECSEWILVVPSQLCQMFGGLWKKWRIWIGNHTGYLRKTLKRQDRKLKEICLENRNYLTTQRKRHVHRNQKSVLTNKQGKWGKIGLKRIYQGILIR